ncbi:MAG: hypothetical protein ACJAYU_005026 [Bradymonadia bacterium]|jgi:hypothetical protein
MGFVDRAKSMHARGDVVRAAVILAQGLKREPRDSEAVGWLLHLYVEELPNPGIEADLLQVLSFQPNGADLLAIVRAELNELGSGDKLKAIDKSLDHSPMQFPSSGPPPPEPPFEPHSAAAPHEEESNQAEPRSEFVQQPSTAPGGENWSSFDSPFDHTGRVKVAPAEIEQETAPANPIGVVAPRLEAPERQPQVADRELSASIDLALSQPLGAIDDLPESLKREYLGAESASPSSTRPMVWAIIAGLALLCVAALLAYASNSSDEVPPETTPEWAPVEEAEPAQDGDSPSAAVVASDDSAEAEGSANQEIIEAPSDGEVE